MTSSPYGVNEQHTYWSSVATSGWVDVEWAARGFRNKNDARGALRELPPGLRVTLKGIEGNHAYVYRDDMGVMRVPAHVLEPWHR